MVEIFTSVLHLSTFLCSCLQCGVGVGVCREVLRHRQRQQHLQLSFCLCFCRALHHHIGDCRHMHDSWGVQKVILLVHLKSQVYKTERMTLSNRLCINRYHVIPWRTKWIIMNKISFMYFNILNNLCHRIVLVFSMHVRKRYFLYTLYFNVFICLLIYTCGYNKYLSSSVVRHVWIL